MDNHGGIYLRQQDMDVDDHTRSDATQTTMVASSVGGSGPPSVRSRISSAAPTPMKIAPHMLGGSKNLMSERFRREQAEQTLLKTKQSLKAVTTELVPQVEDLVKAVKRMQIEKHHQLDLDETSQELLEGLQEQINEIHARDAVFETMLDERMEHLFEKVKEEFQAEKYDLQVFVTQVQDAQDHLLAEVRLLQHEVSASKQFMSQQMETMDDAIASLRNELTRTKDLQNAATQSIQARAVEFDEKLFALDKELLKFKLLLPSSASAQMPPRFSDVIQSTTEAKAIVSMEGNRSSVVITQKLGELASELETVKQTLTAYRAADRQQFDAITNRLRESNKTHQSLKRELEERFQEIQNAYDTMLTKVPSELSRRFLKAQSQWEDQLCGIHARVDELTSRGGSLQPGTTNEIELYDTKEIRSMDTAIHRQVERLDDLHNSVSTLQAEMRTMCQIHETTVDALRSAVSRLETDVLGLYDWTKGKITNVEQEVAFVTNVLQYFQQHAKILPKAS